MGTAGAKVTVASKLPFSLEMQCCDKRMHPVRTQAGMHNEEIFYKAGQIVIINGTAYPNGEVPEGFPPRPLMVGGYALTPGVDKEFFERWLDENKDQAYVKNDLVVARDKLDLLKGFCREHKAIESGLDGLKENDKRLPKKVVGRAKQAAMAEADAD